MHIEEKKREDLRGEKCIGFSVLKIISGNPREKEYERKKRN